MIEHLIGLDLIRDGVKGRVLHVCIGRDTFVDVVLDSGAFCSWCLPRCTEAEPGALLRKIEAAEKERADFRAMVQSTLYPPKPAPPALSWYKSYRGSWGLSFEGKGWDGHAYGAYCDTEEGTMSAEAYVTSGAKNARVKFNIATALDACTLVAGWAREDGNEVPPHPIYGSL